MDYSNIPHAGKISEMLNNGDAKLSYQSMLTNLEKEAIKIDLLRKFGTQPLLDIRLEERQTDDAVLLQFEKENAELNCIMVLTPWAKMIVYCFVLIVCHVLLTSINKCF